MKSVSAPARLLTDLLCFVATAGCGLRMLVEWNWCFVVCPLVISGIAAILFGRLSASVSFLIKLLGTLALVYPNLFLILLKFFSLVASFGDTARRSIGINYMPDNRWARF